MGPDFSLRGQRVLVTGASSGLGEHFAQTLAAAGAHVLLAARRRSKLDELVTQINGNGGSAEALEMDVSCADSVEQGLQRANASAALDVVINNAGVTVGRSALQQSGEDWDSVMDTNLKGCWLVSTAAARHWVAQEHPGTIVNVASILGERVAGSVAPYAVSKAGVLHMTRALALEFARHRIRVNALAPGYVSTELNQEFLASEAGQRLMSRIPTRRFVQPEELDGPLLLLASAAGSAMTGTSLVVDAGHLVSSL